MRKIIIYASVALFWFVGVILFCSLGKTNANTDEHDFTILSVKEDSVKDYNSMPVFQKLAKETGKDVYWVYNTSMQYSNNPDPVGISGIDAIYHSGFSNLKLYNYGKRNRIVAIDKYLKSMPNFSKILEDRPDIKEALTSPDGHIYSLPRVEEMGLKAYPNLLFINKKLLASMIQSGTMPVKSLKESDLVDGLDLSRNEFKEILRVFNKMDGIVPLNFVSNCWQGNESDLIASFGVAENREHKTIIDNKVTFTIRDEAWFNAIVELNSWYSEGLIRSASFTQDQDTFLAKGQNGSYGSFYWWEKETVVANPEDYIIVRPLKNTDGNRYVGVSNELEVEKGACVILDSCQDKAGLLSYFDKFFEPDYSAQLNYGSIEAGAFKSEKVDNKLIPNDDHGVQSADDFRMKNAPYGVVYLTQNEWDNSVEMESRAQLRLNRLNQFVKPYSYKGAIGIPNLNYTEEELNQLNVSEASLGNNILNWMTKSITKEKPSKESWQKFLENNKAAIDTILKINQDAYDRYLEAIK
ncbi:MAG: hypothetical protein NC310_05600 [Roseburia sp.]|nr:hypothetical protein [Anaeroplasma bactoclasticum]MCM1196534.1 hypothetical protein [Roseburia sp.]MCM1557108.1 hypothetical protein [Anaeroplasma bactoclasticum]